MKGSDRKVIFQGVHQLMGSDLGPKWAPGEKKAEQDGVHRHRPAEGHLAAGPGTVPGLSSISRAAGRPSGLGCRLQAGSVATIRALGAGARPLSTPPASGPVFRMGEETREQALAKSAANTAKRPRPSWRLSAAEDRRAGRQGGCAPQAAAAQGARHAPAGAGAPRQPLHRPLRPGARPAREPTNEPMDVVKPAAKADPKLANAWKTKAGARPDRGRIARHARQRVHERQAARVLPRRACRPRRTTCCPTPARPPSTCARTPRSCPTRPTAPRSRKNTRSNCARATASASC